MVPADANAADEAAWFRGAVERIRPAADPFGVVDFAEHDVILQLAFVGGAMHLYALAGTMLFFPMLRVRDWAQGGGIANSITRAVSTFVLVSMAAVYTFGPYAIVEQWNATQPTCTVAIAGYTATNMFRLLECIFRVVPDDTVLKEYPMFVHYILPAVPCIIRDGKPVPPKPGTLQRLGVLIIKKLLMLIVVAWVWRDVFCFEEHTFAASAIIATSFYLHFNMFMDMMTAICAVLGFAVHPSFFNPIYASRSIKELWGKRWNVYINDMLKRLIYIPLAKKKPFPGAQLVGFLGVFLASAAFHEYVWSITFWQRRGRITFGLTVAFFLVQAALITLQMMLAWLLPPAVAKAFDGAPRLVKLVPVWWSLFGTVWLFTQALWDGGWMDGMVALYGRLIPTMLEMTACLGWTEPQQIALCVAAACAAAPLGWDDPLPPRVAQARNSKAKRK